MSIQIRRYALVASLLIGMATMMTSPATAQFLCSAGLRDGETCEGDDDCTGGGVCVIPLGVCSGGESDGFFCICPGSECVAEPVCEDDGSLGTCAGGVFGELCCDLADNCFDGSPCASTQKVCIGGEFKGLPCVTNAHCEGSLCRSTGRYCLEGDNDSFSCFDDADCPGGECVGAAATPTQGATNTPGPPTATRAPTNSPTATIPRTATPVVTPPTVVPTATGTRATPVATVATRTPTETQGITPQVPTDTPAPTRTPDFGMFATTMTETAVGGFQMQVDIPADQLVSFPVEGVIEVFGERFGFTRRRTSRVLNVTDPDGVPFNIAAGTVVLVIEATPRPSRPGGVIVRNEQGGGCGIVATETGCGSAAWLLLGLAVLYRFRRRSL